MAEARKGIPQEDPAWAKKIADPQEISTIHHQINRELTVQCEKLARSLSRLFTIGCLGALAKQISPHTFHFLGLMDDKLGTTDYEEVHL